MKLTYSQIEQNIANLANRESYTADILYELLGAYGRSASSITQLRQGVLNKAEDENAVLQKDVVYFKVAPKGAILEDEIENLKNDPLTGRFRPRYLIATDLIELRARDTKKDTTLARKIADIDKDIAFFYGWTGDEITDDQTEAVADRRAAEKMNELYAEIERVNSEKFVKEGSTFRHELNVFFTRLLFCLFADDTSLFVKNQFTDALKNFTNPDGSDLKTFFVYLFKALDSKDKANLSTPFSAFPYVNGSIFDTRKHSIVVPEFNAQARHLLLECAKSDWGTINPDIFGTMFQGIVDPDKREQGGMDYTSVPNIMKVIEPLFLDSLHERFDEIYNSPAQLRELLARVRGIKIFDPACGSGNFLIIAYKQLRLLENTILSRLDELKDERRSKKARDTNTRLELGVSSGETSQLYSSGISLNNFFGIEIDDFAHEMAVLSLYLAKHQMDAEFEKQFLVKLKHLPLIENKNIVKNNAARADWNTVCPNNGTDEIYLIGNPPYKGARWQTDEQKTDVKTVFEGFRGMGNLDYISVWFKKASDYIGESPKTQFAFVSTNSLTQGEAVEIIWPYIFKKNEIFFAHHSFKWQNSARNQAGVTVVIIGVRKSQPGSKYIFDKDIKSRVENINAYLLPVGNIYIRGRSEPISNIQMLDYGSFALDDGHFTISEEEYDRILAQSPTAKRYLKEFIGAAELLRGIKRWALWITDRDYDEAKKIPVIQQKIEAVREWRKSSNRTSTARLATTPWRFAEIRHQDRDCIIVPIVSSERRDYIPMDFLPAGVIVSNAAFVVYDAEPWLFSLLQSKMHMAWIRAVCGQLETRIRYSSTLGYNTFPVPPLSDTQKQKLKEAARKILHARENHSEKTLAEMYDPDTMPEDLRDAHNENDILVDGLYRQRGFANDEDRLSTLFELYSQMTKEKEPE